jgi:hypothetical protein
LRIEIKRSLEIDAADKAALLELPHDTRVDKIVGLVLLGFGYCSEIRPISARFFPGAGYGILS